MICLPQRVTTLAPGASAGEEHKGLNLFLRVPL